MKIAERIIVVALLLSIIGLGAWLYFAVGHKMQSEQQSLRDAVARGEFEIREEQPPAPDDPGQAQEEWRAWLGDTVSITIGGVPVEASVADSLSERIKGLSDTPYLPDGVVKLFAFGVPGSHSIWMKDMNYALDILWVAQDGAIVHIEPNVSPDNFPESYGSPTSAWFVIEANAGFVATHGIALGDEVVLPVSAAVEENQLLTPQVQEALQ